jgi:hypothetical protein
MHGVARGANVFGTFAIHSAIRTLARRRDAKLLEFIQFHAQRNINRIERLSRGRSFRRDRRESSDLEMHRSMREKH